MEDIGINCQDGSSCRVFFRPSLACLQALVSGMGPVFMVYDRNVSLHAGKISSSLSPVSELALDVSEDTKGIPAVAEICAWLLKSGADRNAVLLAVGGGILTDMAGFAAAVYKRGIRAVYVPTTLLAQVDASVGGKTGVNFQGYKNMIGVIRQPEFTYICLEVLETLPYRHVLEGAAEMIKTFIIKDEGHYRKAIGLFSEMAASGGAKVTGRLADSLGGLVRAAVAVKAGIVAQDQFEGGERRKLNLGHTFAHAVEWCSHSISHGQAVSVGMVCAARLSEAEGLCPSGFSAVLKADLEKCGLETDLPFPLERMADAMGKDKKAENGKVFFVLIKRIGEVTVVPMEVEKAMELLR